ncbi:MAG: hypothetical protein CL537_09070 [Alcanivoracaceae bacterium]|nr:hypothetical protein [Alcanivoracaceae bacterium]|tara:strand:+ start:399 stop:764 length:366 start_codon:yes stop_codon:yes gene_type:complete
MEFSKVSTRNAWAAVEHITSQMRSGTLSPALTQWVRGHGFNPDTTVFSGVCLFDDDIYTGTLIDHHEHVWEFLADLNDDSASELDDVTAELGPKSPDHPDADLCDRVTMAILFHREELIAA